MILRFAILCACLSGLSCTQKRLRVGSPSMEPTILKGESVTYDTAAYRSLKPTRWDVIVFDAPLGINAAFASRIVGLPGETIEIRRNGLHINGKPVSIPTRLKIPSYVPADPHLSLRPTIVRPPSPFTLPMDQYFVLGDNVANALDSRYWGGVTTNTIRGKIIGK